MAKATVYSIVLTPELRDAFLAAAAACERPPALVLRGLMREFIQRQQEAAAAADAPPEAESTPAADVTAVTEAPNTAPTAASDDAAPPAVAPDASEPATAA